MPSRVLPSRTAMLFYFMTANEWQKLKKIRQKQSKEKILELITELEKFTKVKQKKNLSRLLK